MSVRKQLWALTATSLLAGSIMASSTLAGAAENKQKGMISATQKFEEFCFLDIISGGVEEVDLPLADRNRKAQEKGKVRIWWASSSILMHAFQRDKGLAACTLKPDPQGDRPLPETIDEIRGNFEEWINQRSDALGFDIVQPCSTEERSDGSSPSRVVETRQKNVNGQYVRAVFVELVEFSDFLLIPAPSGPDRQLCVGGA